MPNSHSPCNRISRDDLRPYTTTEFGFVTTCGHQMPQTLIEQVPSSPNVNAAKGFGHFYKAGDLATRMQSSY